MPNLAGDGHDQSDARGKATIFERHFLLGELSRNEIDALLTYARVERYPAGREIFPKGSPGNSMMAVLRGTVRIGSVSPEGKEIVLNIINAGEVFGEIALLDGGTSGPPTRSR